MLAQLKIEDEEARAPVPGTQSLSPVPGTQSPYVRFSGKMKSSKPEDNKFLRSHQQSLLFHLLASFSY
jgi:hypothetical protein